MRAPRLTGFGCGVLVLGLFLLFCGSANATGSGYRWVNVVMRADFAPRDGAGALVYHDRMWLIGGWNSRDEAYFPLDCVNDVWSSTDGVQWQCHTRSAPWHPREYHDVAVFDDKMWVLEGWNKENRNDVWYSADGVEWHEVPGTPWKPRHAASVFVYRDALWVVAGNNMESDVWKLERAKGATP